MKQILPIFAMLVCFNISYTQNVGIGTNNPQTKLAIDGAVSYKVQPLLASNAIVIPQDISVVYIIDNGGSTLNNTTASNPKEGQTLTIYNEDAQVVNFSGEVIDAQYGVATFVYINGDWKLVAKNNAGWNVTGNAGTIASTTNPLSNVKANNSFLGTLDANDLVLATNGYERMRITTAADGSTGSIGIGTSSPTGKLSIYDETNTGFFAVGIQKKNNGGGLTIGKEGSGDALSIVSSGRDYAIFSELTGVVTNGSARGHYFGDLRTNNSINNGTKLGVWVESVFNFLGNNIGLLVDVDGGTTNTSALFRGGNVGIVASSNSYVPTTYLDINVPDVTTTSTTPGMLNVMSENTGGAADIGGSISLGGYRNTTTEYRAYGTIEGRKTLTSTGSSSGYLMFKTNNGGTLTERMRIFNDGVVRINSLAGSGIRVVSAGADGSLDAVTIGTLETDPSWSEAANINGTTGVLSRTGRVMTESTFVVGTSITTATGPNTGADNQYHNVVFGSSQTAMTGISIYATGSHLDGDIKIFGVPATDLVTTTNGWYGLNAGVTSAGSTTNTVSSGADDQYHTAQCPNNRVATGIEIYASGALDGNMKLRCNTLVSGYSTTNNGIGVESLINTPFTDANNINHMSTCPAGTFVKGIRIYASSRLDNQVQVFCTGIKKD